MSDWIEWKGGDLPVSIGTLVEVIFRDQKKRKSRVEHFHWDNLEMKSDIIAYRVIDEKPSTSDTVNHPPHYTSHPSGIECIQVTEHMGFNLGNATKYIWRADLKGNAIEDLEKAAWYVQREIERRMKAC